MARYIDADKLIVKLNEAQIEFDRNYYGLGEAKQIVDNAPTVDAIEIPKNVTNGDMIKILFPNIEIEGIGGEIKCIAAQNGTSYFALDWWNAPYKRGREE